MRQTLMEWARHYAHEGDAAFKGKYGQFFLVADPRSVFHLPEGPMTTMRVDLKLVAASQAGAFHRSTPAFVPIRQSGSVYSFVSIGRTENCDIALRDESVSKLHALLRQQDGVWTVQDQGSANGTKIKDQPLKAKTATALVPGQTVSFGNIVLHVMDIEQLLRLIDGVLPAWRSGDFETTNA